MEREFLNLSIWDQFTVKEAEEVAQALGRCLPNPWKFEELTFHEMGDQKRPVACYSWKSVRFSLIPGGETTLGYDRDNPFVPDKEQRKAWRFTQEEYGCTLKECLDLVLTPLRQVSIAPFLLECRVGANWDEGDQGFFRLATSDEWEYGCAAGSRTLWRWGNQVPLDCYPAGGGIPTWTVHQKPNAFGLLIAMDPYEPERTAKPGSRRGVIERGGDGGGAICGGSGFLSGWLTLASAFWDTSNYVHNEAEQVLEPGDRRAYSIPLECLD